MRISIIVAADAKGCIGANGRLPWHFPADLQWFREKTTGHAVIFGRKTVESLKKKLENRFVCRISASRIIPIDNANFDITCPNVDFAIEVCRHRGYSQCFIGGGAAIYKQAIDRVHDIYLTEVPGEFEGDTFFPFWPLEQHGWVRSEEIIRTNSSQLKFWHFQKIPS